MSRQVLIQHLEKSNYVNNEIYGRNIPSTVVNMNFFPSPVSTKYQHLMIQDTNKEVETKIKYYGEFDVSNTFFPSDSKPHFSGFAHNIDLESGLRNQIYPLEHCDKNKWYPDSKSNMYINNIDFINTNKNLDNDLLFNQETFDDFNPNIANSIGNDIFYNSTRVQLKDLK